MRIITGLLFTLATIVFFSQPALGQMLVPGQTEIGPQKFGNCLIYHLRNLDDLAKNTDLTSTCNAPNGWLPTLHDTVFSFPGVMAFYNAEKAYCDSPGCTSNGKDMRMVLVGNTLPNIYIAGPSDQADAVTIVITTAMVDFIQRNAHALMNDFMEDPQLAPQGFYAWVESLRALGGKSCSLPVTWNTTSLSPKISQDTLMRTAMTTYTILFAHELAHLRFNRTCGYQNDPKLTSEPNALGVEKACDKIGFAQLTKAGIGMPLFAVGTLIGWQDYITLKRPKLMGEFPGGPLKFREAFPVLSLKDRAQGMVDDWERTCSSGLKAPMCFPQWRDLVKEARKIINSPTPAECIP